jgi:hypothetical protein
VRTSGPVERAGIAQVREAVDPGLYTLARDTHRCGEVGLLPALLVTLNDQEPIMKGQPALS